MQEPLAVRARWMINADLGAVLQIERASEPHPWDEEELRTRLRQRNVIGMVAEADGEVVGYVVYELHKRHIRLLHLAVAPQRQRRAIGRQLIALLQSKLCSSRRERLVYLVDERDLSRQLFARRYGLECVSTWRHYFGDGVDAYEFELWATLEEADDSTTVPAIREGVNRVAH